MTGSTAAEETAEEGADSSVLRSVMVQVVWVDAAQLDTSSCFLLRTLSESHSHQQFTPGVTLGQLWRAGKLDLTAVRLAQCQCDGSGVEEMVTACRLQTRVRW